MSFIAAAGTPNGNAAQRKSARTMHLLPFCASHTFTRKSQSPVNFRIFMSDLQYYIEIHARNPGGERLQAAYLPWLCLLRPRYAHLPPQLKALLTRAGLDDPVKHCGPSLKSLAMVKTVC